MSVKSIVFVLNLVAGFTFGSGEQTECQYVEIEVPVDCDGGAWGCSHHFRQDGLVSCVYGDGTELDHSCNKLSKILNNQLPSEASAGGFQGGSTLDQVGAQMALLGPSTLVTG